MVCVLADERHSASGPDRKSIDSAQTPLRNLRNLRKVSQIVNPVSHTVSGRHDGQGDMVDDGYGIAVLLPCNADGPVGAVGGGIPSLRSGIPGRGPCKA